MSTGVDVFNFLAFAPTNVIHNVEVFEVSTNVICEIDAVGRVAACSSPVSGVTLQGLHSCQTQAVQFPVLCVLVHWSVVLERDLPKSGQVTIQSTPGYDKGPGSARLGLEITVGWVAVSAIIVKSVDTTF